MRPNAVRHETHPPEFYRMARAKSGLGTNQMARAVGISPRRLRAILSGSVVPSYPEHYTIVSLAIKA